MQLHIYLAKNYLTFAAFVWLFNVQYFIVQIIVAATSTASFSLINNTISDLGNTVCGRYDERYVCSPDHGLMNTSFIVVGLTIIIGGLLFAYGEQGRWARFGFIGLVLSGVGTIFVGLFPENSAGNYHALGASLPFLMGNVSLVILGLSLKLTRMVSLATIASGTLGLAALILFITHNYGPLGLGGMERLVAYPQTIWMIIYGTGWLSLRKKHSYPS
jgi:hypothetical membrane protein